MIEPLKDFPPGVLAFVCHGEVSKSDYESVVVPAVRDAVTKHGKLRFYYETGADFAGIDAGAMWEDFKIGIGHLTRWERVAVVTDVDWTRHAVRFFSFLMPGDVRAFPRAESERARAWIVGKE